MSQNIAGKVVVITGASSGLGEATARHLAGEGAKLVLGARRIDRLRALATEVAGAAIQTDVTDREQVKALVDHAVKTHGRIDVILNNAGLMPHSLLERGKVDDWEPDDRRQHERGALRHCCRATSYEQAEERAHHQRGLVAAYKVRPGSAVYATTRAAVRMLTEGLRQEVKPYNIRTTIISPGAVQCRRA